MTAKHEAVNVLESFVTAWLLTKNREFESEFKDRYLFIKSKHKSKEYFEVLIEGSVFDDGEISLNIPEDGISRERVVDFDETKFLRKYCYYFNDALSIGPDIPGKRCAVFSFYDIETLKNFLIEFDQLL